MRKLLSGGLLYNTRIICSFKTMYALCVVLTVLSATSVVTLVPWLLYFSHVLSIVLLIPATVLL